jgi:RNase H-fold protein (predicted Holliday junction resolvase)
MVAIALTAAALSWLVTMLVALAAARALRDSRLATVEALQHLAEAERESAAARLRSDMAAARIVALHRAYDDTLAQYQSRDARAVPLRR